MVIGQGRRLIRIRDTSELNEALRRGGPLFAF